MAIADAAAGLDAALQDQIRQRLYLQQYADTLKQRDFENQRQLAADALAQRRMTLDEQNQGLLRQQQQANIDSEIQRRADESEKDNRTFALGAREQLNPGTAISSDSPLYGSLNKYGLLTGTVQQPGGLGTAFQGPLNTGETPQAVANDSPRIIAMSPTAKQAENQATQAEKADALKRQEAKDAADESYRQADLKLRQQALDKPPAVQLITTVGPDGKPVQQFVPKTPGVNYDKPASGQVENRLASAQAVQQTGNDIISELSDPAIKATLGPAMGRANTLRDFIGNPPPEFSELAGQIESYALANMGVHGMRSAEGARRISEMLDQHHTPESLTATIRGLGNFSQHFMENEGRAPQPSSPAAAPSTGVKRYNPATGKLE